MRKKVAVLLMFSLLTSLLLAIGGCGKSTEPADQPQEVKELRKFNLGYLPTTGHSLYFIAQEKGYFKDNGLDVELFQFNNSGEGLNAIKAGKLDAGPFGTPPPLTFIANGTDFTFFGGSMSEGHALIALPDKAETLKDLKNHKGKKIAVVRLSTGDIIYRISLSAAGVDWKKDLTILELESPAAVLEAVKKGTVDGGWVWIPFRKMAEDQGVPVVLESGDLYPFHTCCRQIALTENISKNPQLYQDFLVALIQAYHFFKSNPEESVELISKYVKVDKAIIEAETYGEHISLSPDPNKAAIKQIWEDMKAIGYIQSDINIDQHIKTDLYEKALEQVLKDNPKDEIYLELKSQFKP